MPGRDGFWLAEQANQDDALDASTVMVFTVVRRAYEYSSAHDWLNNLQVAREILAAVGHPSCGLLIDAYHFERTGAGGRGFEDVPAHEIFAFQYSDVPDAPPDEDAEALVDSPDAFTHDGTHLSLEQPVRELLIAELPIAPVCKADCQGLCPTCGANRNTDEGRACGHTAASDEQVTNPGTRRGLAALSDVKLPS